MKIFCSFAMKAALLEIAPRFEKETGTRLEVEWASTNDLSERIAAGAGGELVIVSSDAVEALIARGLVEAGSRTDLARAGIGAAVRAGAEKPDISSSDALRSALLSAQSIGYSRTGVSGLYFAGLLNRLGVAEAMTSRSMTPTRGTPVGELVARGDVELGFQQISELLPVPGIDIVGPLPGEVQQTTVFSAGLLCSCRCADLARHLIYFLVDAAAEEVYRRTGLEMA